MNAFDWERRREEFGGAGEPEARVIVFNDCGGAGAGGVGGEEAGFDDQRAGRGFERCGCGGCIFGKDQVSRGGVGDGVHGANLRVRVAMQQVAAECVDELCKRHALLPFLQGLKPLFILRLLRHD
jgi:hypothetical protein